MRKFHVSLYPVELRTQLRRRQKEAEKIEKARIRRSEQEAAVVGAPKYNEKICSLNNVPCKKIRELDRAALAFVVRELSL